MALTTNLQNSYALIANSNDAVGGVNGTDTSISYSTVGGKLSAGFNGTSSRVTMSGVTLTGTGDMTFTGWLYLTALAHDSYFISNRKNPDDNIGIYNFHVDTAGKLNWWDYDGGAFGFNTTSLSTGTLSTATWYHVAFVRSGGTSGTYYINGSSSGTTTAAASKSYSSSATHPMILGTEGETGGATYTLDGQMVGWQFYTRALSGAELLELYNNGNVLQYPFSKGSPSFINFM